MLKTLVNIVPEWKIRLHLQSSIAATCIVFMKLWPKPLSRQFKTVFRAALKIFLAFVFCENLAFFLLFELTLN